MPFQIGPRLPGLRLRRRRPPILAPGRVPEPPIMAIFISPISTVPMVLAALPAERCANAFSCRLEREISLHSAGQTGVDGNKRLWYHIQHRRHVPIPVASFDGKTMCFSQPHGVDTPAVGITGMTTRLSVSGNSNSSLNGNYYVYTVDEPNDVEVYPANFFRPFHTGRHGHFLRRANGEYFHVSHAGAI